MTRVLAVIALLLIALPSRAEVQRVRIPMRAENSPIGPGFP